MHRSIQLYSLSKVKSTDCQVFRSTDTKTCHAFVIKIDYGKYPVPEIIYILMMSVWTMSIKGHINTILIKQTKLFDAIGHKFFICSESIVTIVEKLKTYFLQVKLNKVKY